MLSKLKKTINKYNMKAQLAYVDKEKGLVLNDIKANPDVNYKIIVTCQVRELNRCRIVDDNKFRYFKDSKSIWIDAMSAFICHEVYLMHEENWVYILFNMLDKSEHLALLGRLEDDHYFAKHCIKKIKEFDINSI